MRANRGLMFAGVLGALSLLPFVHHVTHGTIVAHAESADAQLGGLMRRAQEAIKKEPPQQPTEQTAPAPTTPDGRDPFADPAIVPITADQVARFEKALNHEITERNKLIERLKAQKSPEEYQACAATPEGIAESMQAIQDFADKYADAPAEEMIKAQQTMYADLAAKTAKRCGEQRWDFSQRSARMKEIELEAAEIAIPPGWTPPNAPVARLAYAFPPRLLGEDDLRVLSDSGAPGLPSDLSSWEPVEHLDAAQFYPRLYTEAFRPIYAMLKERIGKYCSDQEKARAAATIVQVPGESAVIWYVYTEDEAEAMRPRCNPILAIFSLFTPVEASLNTIP